MKTSVALRSAMEEFLRSAEADAAAFPGSSLADWKAHWENFFPFKSDSDLEHLLGGLRKAGLE